MRADNWSSTAGLASEAGELDLLSTGDETFTLRDKATGELFHNSAGAYKEAVCNYVEPSEIESIAERNSHLSILDSCFGLGYNSFALLETVATRGIRFEKIKIEALESDRNLLRCYPAVLRQSCFNNLLYASRSGALSLDGADFDALFNSDSNTVTLTFELRLPDRTKLPKEANDSTAHDVSHPPESSLLQNHGRSPANETDGPRANTPTLKSHTTTVELRINLADLRVTLPMLAKQAEPDFNLVFHDPFSPNKVPQLWTSEIFSIFRKLLDKHRGRLLTYCAASAIRGGLIENGFHVYRTMGVGRKTGGTLASVIDLSSDSTVSNSCILPLLDEEQENLRMQKAIPYRDSSLRGSRLEVLKRREEELKQWKLAHS